RRAGCGRSPAGPGRTCLSLHFFPWHFFPCCAATSGAAVLRSNIHICVGCHYGIMCSCATPRLPADRRATPFKPPLQEVAKTRARSAPASAQRYPRRAVKKARLIVGVEFHGTALAQIAELEHPGAQLRMPACLSQNATAYLFGGFLGARSFHLPPIL